MIHDKETSEAFKAGIGHAQEKQKYNGWSNYATWRVNLEIVDGINFVKEDISSSDDKLPIEDISSFIRDVVERAVEESTNSSSGFAYDYAMAFLSDVNYREIAEAVVANYPDLLSK